MKSPAMVRSRTQLAISYAPGAYFTFEGGRGCFLSMPAGVPPSPLQRDAAVRQQVHEQLTEFVTSWSERGMRCRSERADLPPLHIEQTLDRSLIYQGMPQVRLDQFVFVEPSMLAYIPAPLNFHCSRCGLLHYYDNVDDFARTHEDVEERTDCTDGERHQWKQLDVFFHHWSGRVLPLHPEHNCSCGGKEFRLHKSATGVFSDWKFSCATCNTYSNLIRRDPDTREIFKEYPTVTHLGDETTMLPVSYRSTAVHYPQIERLIPHNDFELIARLQPGRENDLALWLMSRYGYPNPPPSDETIRVALAKKGMEAQFLPYETLKKMAKDELARGSHASAAAYRESAESILKGLVEAGHVPNSVEPSPVLSAQCFARKEFARRYDPVRLSLEHAMLEKKHLSPRDQRSHADLFQPPEDIRPAWVEGEGGVVAYQGEMQTACNVLGIERIHLIRELEIVQYTFGFSRVNSSPVTEFNNKPMPVRLNLYPHIELNQRPIYMLNQKNEALYVRLRQEMVINWLMANHVDIGEPLAPGQGLGSRYIERYGDFGYFLEPFRKKNSTQRNLCSMVYLLLHTMAHQLIHVVAEFSGLEHGSLGESIYPADLAFVVYRSALTPDLGNLSSMWRNFGAAVLRQMHDTQMLQCGSGTVCEQRGGACPGCIMVPEVVCLAWNDLLSRSALAGGGKPHWDASPHRRLTGFLEVTTGSAVTTP